MRHRGFSQALLALLAANIAPAGVDGFALLPTPAWLPLAAGLPRCYREGSGSDGTLTGLRMANAGGRPGFWGKKQTIQWGECPATPRPRISCSQNLSCNLQAALAGCARHSQRVCYVLKPCIRMKAERAEQDLRREQPSKKPGRILG